MISAGNMTPAMPEQGFCLGDTASIATAYHIWITLLLSLLLSQDLNYSATDNAEIIF